MLKSEYLYACISVFAALMLAFLLFSTTGVLALAAIALLFFVPAFAIVSNFELGLDEKLVFSFFIGIGVFPLLAWYVNKIVPSLRVSAVAVAALAVAAGFLLWLGRRRTK
ncbi:hypothetical protein HYY72_02845 [Candidatus Woesearchaeota archaeon]|nr:hypothetical protein [Candidatus Woesearchaeota archaeon]